jgi:hypothetical protein
VTDDVEIPFSIRKTMDNTRQLNDLVLIPPDSNRAAPSFENGPANHSEDRRDKVKKIAFMEYETESIRICKYK